MLLVTRNCEGLNIIIGVSSLCAFIIIFQIRYAIGYAERSGPKAHIGWLSSLANATDQPYGANNTGGPSIKVKAAKLRDKWEL